MKLMDNYLAVVPIPQNTKSFLNTPTDSETTGQVRFIGGGFTQASVGKNIAFKQKTMTLQFQGVEYAIVAAEHVVAVLDD